MKVISTYMCSVVPHEIPVKKEIEYSRKIVQAEMLKYSVIQKDGLNFVRLYFLNYI